MRRGPFGQQGERKEGRKVTGRGTHDGIASWARSGPALWSAGPPSARE